MTLKKIEAVPPELSSQLISGEEVFYFSYITFVGGCGSSKPRQEYWIAITNDRVLYKTKVKENNRMIGKDGIIPLDEISFMEVTEESTGGCSSKKFIGLTISSSGGVVIIPIPTKEKAIEIRKVYSEIRKKFHS